MRQKLQQQAVTNDNQAKNDGEDNGDSDDDLFGDENDDELAGP